MLLLHRSTPSSAMSRAQPAPTAAAVTLGPRGGFSQRAMFAAAVTAITMGVAAGTAIFAYRRTARARVDAAPSLLGGCQTDSSANDESSNGSADGETTTLAMEFEALLASERLRAASRPPSRQTPAHRLRPPVPEDIPALARSWFGSYNAESRANGGADLFPSLESAQALVGGYVGGAGKVGLVAVAPSSSNEERKVSDVDEIVASAFNDESDVERGVVGCGPWTVSTGHQGRGVGFECISNLVRGSINRGAQSLRLLQGTTNHASAALYAKLGFQVREPLAFWAGRPAPEVCRTTLALHLRWTLSLWGSSDVPELATMWSQATGCDRRGALGIVGASFTRKAKRWVLRDEQGVVVSVANAAQHMRVLAWAAGKQHRGESLSSNSHRCVSFAFSVLLRFLLAVRLFSAFTTGFGSMGSSCAVSIAAFQHLLCAAASDTDTGFAEATLMLHSGTRLYPQLTRWLLASGMKITRTANLMCLGQWTPIPHQRFVYCPSTELS